MFDKEIAEIPLSGKLDLRGSLEDVVEIICQSLFLRQETDKEVISEMCTVCFMR